MFQLSGYTWNLKKYIIKHLRFIINCDEDCNERFQQNCGGFYLSKSLYSNLKSFQCYK